LTKLSFRHLLYQALVANKRVQTKMWAFDLPLWAYVLVVFCPMGFCPTLGKQSWSLFVYENMNFCCL